MKSTKITLVLLLLLVMSPVGMNESIEASEPIGVSQISQTTNGTYLSEVPYVWQEVNGYCMSAALSMVLQGMGMDIEMFDLFAAMGTGFSALYIGYDNTRMFYPGVLVRQPSYFNFFSELYGVDLTVYLDSSSDFGGGAAYSYERVNVDYIDFSNTTTSPFDVLKGSIDAGIPLAVSVDIYYMPPDDYDIFRQYSAPLSSTGIGHAVTIVGYNDATRQVYIQDPGVGVIDNRGYPDDGRWNYTMSYFEFNRAWESSGYYTLKLAPGLGPAQDFEEKLGDYICKSLRGDRASYLPGLENYYFLSPGKDAFSGMALDLTVECIADYARYFTEVNKPDALLRMGHIIELFLTTHYYSYKTALESLPDILTGVNLQVFLDTANDALPHFEALSHNASINSGVQVEFRDSLIFSCFEEIALDFDSSGNLEGSISQHQEELDEIRTHLFAIADAWDDAADALEVALDLQTTEPIEASLLIIASGAGVILLAVAVILFRRRK